MFKKNCKTQFLWEIIVLKKIISFLNEKRKKKFPLNLVVKIKINNTLKFSIECAKCLKQLVRVWLDAGKSHTEQNEEAQENRQKKLFNRSSLKIFFSDSISNCS